MQNKFLPPLPSPQRGTETHGEAKTSDTTKLDPHEPVLQMVAFSEMEKWKNKTNAKIKLT